MDLFDAVGGGSISFSKGLGPGASEWALQEQDKTAMPPRQVRINLAVKILMFALATAKEHQAESSRNLGRALKCLMS